MFCIYMTRHSFLTPSLPSLSVHSSNFPRLAAVHMHFTSVLYYNFLQETVIKYPLA